MSTKSKKTDIRHDYLSALVNAIFDIKVNSTMKGDNNSVTVVRGSGREIGKCNFTELYRTDFTRLFEYTFTYENCKFKYDGLQKVKQRFDRSIAIKNAIAFFKKNNIMLNYVFHSRAESKLFSRLIYRYIKQLLDVLFDEYYINDKKEFEKVVEEKYERLFTQIRDEVDTTDIYELIYKDARISDAELLPYDGADSVMLVDSCYEYISYYSSETINTSLKLRAAGKELIYSRSNISKNIYSIDSKDVIPIAYTSNVGYYPVKIIDLQRKDFFIPRFFCVEFKLSELSTSLVDEAEDKKRIIYDMLSTRVNEYITKKYIRTEKQAANRLENIEGILKKVLQINYKRLFSDDRYFENYFKLGLGRFRKFIAISNLESNNELILFRYLVSVWVDEFSHILYCMQSDQEYKKE